MSELSFGQKIDDNGLVMPWFTHGSLDEIKSWDLSEKIVVMFGAGMGDIYLSKKCKELHVIERNDEWVIQCTKNKFHYNAENIYYYHRPCNDCSGNQDFYCQIPDGVIPDIIINDDAYRYEVIEMALTMPRPLTLITDNWMQSYVFMCPAGVELLKDFEAHIHEQSDHTDNDGVNKWKTAIHFIK